MVIFTTTACCTFFGLVSAFIDFTKPLRLRIPGRLIALTLATGISAVTLFFLWGIEYGIKSAWAGLVISILWPSAEWWFGRNPTTPRQRHEQRKHNPHWKYGKLIFGLILGLFGIATILAMGFYLDNVLNFVFGCFCTIIGTALAKSSRK